MHFHRVVQLQSFLFQAPYGTYARTVKKYYYGIINKKPLSPLAHFSH